MHHWARSPHLEVMAMRARERRRKQTKNESGQRSGFRWQQPSIMYALLGAAAVLAIFAPPAVLALRGTTTQNNELSHPVVASQQATLSAWPAASPTIIGATVDPVHETSCAGNAAMPKTPDHCSR